MKVTDPVKLFLVGTGTLALICWGGCTQDRSPRKAATQFVKTSEIDFVFAKSYAAGYRDDALKKARPEKEIDCVMTQITPELMLPMLAKAFSMKCSDDEFRQAIEFYESDTGKIYLRNERMRVQAILGMSTEVPREYSLTEEDRIVAFEQTRIGKLVTSQDPSLRAAMKDAMLPQLAAIFKQCRNLQ